MDLDDKQGTQLDGEALRQLKTSRMGFSIGRKPRAQHHVWCWFLVDFLWYVAQVPTITKSELPIMEGHQKRSLKMEVF